MPKLAAAMCLALIALAIGQPRAYKAEPGRAEREQTASPQQGEKPADKGLQAEAIRAYVSWLRDWEKRTGNAIDKKHVQELEDDVEIGASYVPTAEKENKPSKNQTMMDRLERVARPIAEIAADTQVKATWGDGRLNPFKYEFRLVEGKDVNAFSLPGGYVFVFEGLMDFVESDDELAAVLAHEISHASLRHLATMAREQSKFDTYALPMILIAILKGGETGVGVASLGQLINMSTQSGWSVKAELAADYAGFQYMQASKYNPVAALTFMERLAQKQLALEQVDWGIYRTHPPSRERADYITQSLKLANLPIRRSQVAASFRVALKESGDAKIEGYFGPRKLFTFSGAQARPRAEEAARRLNDFYDSVPDLFEVQATGDGTLLGRKAGLFKYNTEDADGNAKRLEELATQSAIAVKASLYTLAFRIWDVTWTRINRG